MSIIRIYTHFTPTQPTPLRYRKAMIVKDSEVNTSTTRVILGVVLGFALCGCEPPDTASPSLSDKEALGQALFFDTSLSTPAGQACASCHAPQVAFTDPDKHFPVSKGVLPGRFGNRNTPTAAYSAFSPLFHYDASAGTYVGGQFLDGRAATLEDQAQAPLLNPLEMANPDKLTVVEKVQQSSSAALFQQVFGADIFSDTAMAYVKIAEAIAAFERTRTFAPFTSKYDYYLAGRVRLTAQERRGLTVFEAENKGNCAACHPDRPAADGTPPLFTDFSYDNLGVPANPNNPFYALPAEFNVDGAGFVDRGLGKTTGHRTENGKFKVPTLRNIAVTAPYMHNGVFNTLRDVVEFYNSRDISDRFGAPEVPENVNKEELGNLGLSEQEIEDLVAFLQTLTDGYMPLEFPWRARDI